MHVGVGNDLFHGLERRLRWYVHIGRQQPRFAKLASPHVGGTLRFASQDNIRTLDPAIAFAEKVKKNIDDNVKDYTCVLIRQERIDGKLGDQQIMNAKIRNDPFSVYLKFLKPTDIAGREAAPRRRY